MRREGRYGGYPWSRSHSDNPHNSNENNSGSGNQQDLEMKRRNKFQQRFNRSRNGNKSAIDPNKTIDSLFDDSYLMDTVDDEGKIVAVGGPSQAIDTFPRMPSPTSNRNIRRSTGAGVTVKTDIVVEVDEELGMSGGSASSSMSKETHSYPTFTPRDIQNRVERHASAYAWKPSDHNQ